MLLYWFCENNSKHSRSWTIATQSSISFLNDSQFLNKMNDSITHLKHTLCSILKGLSLHTKPFEGFTLQSESFEGIKVLGDQKSVLWDALLHHLAKPNKGIVHPKNENSIINYSPSCRSKPIRHLFIFTTQIKIFLMKSESFLTLHRQQWNYHI